MYFNIRKTTRTFTKFNQYSLRIPCLPIPALGLKKVFHYLLYNADKGFAPLSFDHETNMLLLHQPA